MQQPFFKYHGTGNDFILLDNRTQSISLTREQVAMLCHRRFGIGADGLMLLEEAADADFRMVYYNADGNESSMCGNGGRCITAFAHKLGIIKDKATFIAIDGMHTADIHPNGLISLHMQDVTTIRRFKDHTELDTGSPHYVLWVDDVQAKDVVTDGRDIRQQAAFMPKGINVNFVQQVAPDQLQVRTYERGVEDETMSCGTGVTAAAIAASCNLTGTFITAIQTPGGALQVAFNKDHADTANQVVLTGPAVFVFEGTIEL